MEKVLVTTTSVLQGYEITKYHGYISANFITGADFIMDFFAGFTDFFGGISGSYTDEIDALKAMAVDSLEIKAEKIGMNAIIGLKVDLEPIFGGTARSMFMVSASGTAVYVEGLHEALTEEEKKKKELIRRIKSLGNLQEISHSPDRFTKYTAGELDSFLIGLSSKDAVMVIKMFLEYCKESPLETTRNNIQSRKKINAIREYLKTVPKELYINELNGEVTKEKSKAMKLLGILDYNNLLQELKKSTSKEYDIEVITVLASTPEFIEIEDSVVIKEIIDILESRYSSNVEIKKYGIINKKDMWICPKCKSPIELKDNKCSICLVDKYGMPCNFKYESKLLYLKSIYEILIKG